MHPRRAAYSLLAAALSTVLLVACGETAPQPGAADAGPPAAGLTPEQAARVVAKVGDRSITLGDYAATLERMDQFDRLRYQTKEARRELLKEMIDVELLAQEARRRGLHEKPEAQEATRQLLRDALLSDVHGQLPAPGELPAEEVRAYYDAHREEFREPERRRVSAIVVEDAKTADGILETLRKARKDDGTVDATTWGRLFAEHSRTGAKEGRTAPADLAGDLGIVGPPDDPKGENPRVPAQVRRAVFEMAKVGTFTDAPIQVGTSLYLVRLSGQTKGHERSLAEADRSIRVALLKERLAKLEAELEQELRKKHQVTIDDAALAKVPPPEVARAAAQGDDGSDAPAPEPSAAPSVAPPVAPSADPSSAPSP
jgi:peptidyl-prolyl cis-trans isomerase C